MSCTENFQRMPLLRVTIHPNVLRTVPIFRPLSQFLAKIGYFGFIMGNIGPSKPIKNLKTIETVLPFSMVKTIRFKLENIVALHRDISWWNHQYS